MQPGSGRKYGFACLTCRKRKIRCDGKKPTCQNCNKSGDGCSYKSDDAQLRRFSDQLSKAQKRIEELEHDLKNLAVLNHGDRDRLLSELTGRLEDGQNISASGARGLETPRNEDPGEDPGIEDDEGQAEMSIDEHGAVQYFGATSRFHARSSLTSTSIASSKSAEIPNTEDYHRWWLRSNSRFQQSWERVALSNLAQDGENDITKEAAAVLLQLYWTWQAPLHNCIYRRTFFRDMALSGPYFSKFLLNVIYAHACRHVRTDDHRFTMYSQGEYFLKKAKLLFLEELDRETPRIPTIQGLLVLGGRQCAIGKQSEGWLYTGMAIRMMKDLGLHVHGVQAKQTQQLEPDDLEATKRLCLSAYLWDKSISLCLGRPPALTRISYSPENLLDHSDDNDDWRPMDMDELSSIYPPTRSYNSLNFSYLCRLAMITNEIYGTIYSGRLNDLKTQAISNLENRLHDFYQKLPAELRIDQITDLDFCPPPHIFCMNILYHTMLILLFRPFSSWWKHPRLSKHPLAAHAHKICIEEAINVNAFFAAYGRTFSFQKQTYLVSYCVYTAATVEVQEVHHPDKRIAQLAASRLATTLKMLEAEVKQTPGIRRSVDIIKSQLDSNSASIDKIPPQMELHHSGINTLPAEYRPQDTRVAEFSGATPSGDWNTSSSTQQAEGGTTFAQNATTPHYEFEGMNQQHLIQGLASGGDDESFPDMQTPLAMWGDWNAFDLSGGFVPDAANWTLFDSSYINENRSY